MLREGYRDGYDVLRDVHPTGGSLRVFKQLVWLEVDSVKMALSGSAHRWSNECVQQKKVESL